MSRRNHRRVVPLPRSARGIARRVRRILTPSHRIALKRAALRDCLKRCVYCAEQLALEAATLDHVHPISRGGANDSGNLVVACAPCNRMKGDLLPAEFFGRYPWAGQNFVRYARTAHRALKRGAKRAVSLAYAA
jgi:5-methylcytosine-specific restriction endonuclease McrA